jgi:putative phosphoribosyl transferase
LAVPRGGVPVAKEVARAIGAPLDLVTTRKIGAPGQPELAVGAVSQEGEIVTNPELVTMLNISEDYLREESSKQVEEIRTRMRKYRGDRPYPKLAGKTVVIVDDGIATGATIRAAVKSVKRMNAAKVILAAPVGPPDAVRELSRIADRVVCLSMPEGFEAIGEFYEEFEQVEDETVRAIMRTESVRYRGS